MKRGLLTMKKHNVKPIEKMILSDSLSSLPILSRPDGPPTTTTAITIFYVLSFAVLAFIIGVVTTATILADESVQGEFLRLNLRSLGERVRSALEL